MYADPQTITVNAVAKAMNRINSDNFASEYFLRNTLDEFRLKIRHSNYVDKTSKKIIDRHNVEFVQTVYATSTVPQIVRKAYVVFENERADGSTEPLNFDSGFIAWFTSPNITKLLNLES